MPLMSGKIQKRLEKNGKFSYFFKELLLTWANRKDDAIYYWTEIKEIKI